MIAHRLADVVVGHGDDAGGAGADQRDGERVGDARGHAVDERVRRLGGDRVAGLEREQRGRGRLGDDADDLGRQAEQVAHAHQPADARAHPDRHVHDVEVGPGREQLEGVRRHAEHEVGLERADHPQPVARRRAAGRARGPPGSRARGRRGAAPRATIAAFFSVLLPSGTTIVTGTPCSPPANARLWPWLPRVALTMPGRSGCSRASRSTSTSPPRILKAPVGVVFSCLTHTSVPSSAASSGQAYVGVTGTWRPDDRRPPARGRPCRTAGRRSGIGHHQVEADVVGLGRQVVDELLGEGGADGAAPRPQPGQEAVVVAAALAEPATVGA